MITILGTLRVSWWNTAVLVFLVFKPPPVNSSTVAAVVTFNAKISTFILETGFTMVWKPGTVLCCDLYDVVN